VEISDSAADAYLLDNGVADDIIVSWPGGRETHVGAHPGRARKNPNSDRRIATPGDTYLCRTTERTTA
jgi:hypothetical protein